MTGIALLDALTSNGTGAACADANQACAATLATQLIDAALLDLERLAAYERQFGSPNLYSHSAVEILRSVYQLFEQWETEAKQLLSRAQSLAAQGHEVPKLELLQDACNRVRARLGVTPEKLARSIEQARQGRVVPVETIRNELRAGVRG